MVGNDQFQRAVRELDDDDDEGVVAITDVGDANTPDSADDDENLNKALCLSQGIPFDENKNPEWDDAGSRNRKRDRTSRLNDDGTEGDDERNDFELADDEEESEIRTQGSLTQKRRTNVSPLRQLTTLDTLTSPTSVRLHTPRPNAAASSSSPVAALAATSSGAGSPSTASELEHSHSVIDDPDLTDCSDVEKPFPRKCRMEWRINASGTGDWRSPPQPHPRFSRYLKWDLFVKYTQKGLGLFLGITNSSELPPGWQIQLSAVVSLRSNDREQALATKNFTAQTLLHNNFDHGWHDFIGFEELKGLHDSELHVQADVELLGELFDISLLSTNRMPHITPKFLGLVNQGSTCYLNSLLQSLFHIGAFRRAVYLLPTQDSDDWKTNIPFALQRLFFRLQFCAKPVSTEELTASFGWTSDDSFVQHDVHELNCVLLDNLESKMKGTAADGMIPALFSGKLTNYIRCINVNHSTDRSEPFNVLSLVVKDCRDIYDSFHKYIEEETLDGSNQYSTEEHGLQDAKKGLRFEKLPPVLNLHLKRWEISSNYQPYKVNDLFQFYPIIDLSKFLPDPEGDVGAADDEGDEDDENDPTPDEENDDDDADEDDADDDVENVDGSDEGSSASHRRRNSDGAASKKRRHYRHNPDAIYHLHAVCVHAGDTSSGHYYAFIRPTSQPMWYKFNDQTVTAASELDAIDSNFGGDIFRRGRGSLSLSNPTYRLGNAYMLVYVRESEIDKIMNDDCIDAIPDHLRKIQDEHLYGEARYATEEHFFKKRSTLYGLVPPQVELPKVLLRKDDVFCNLGKALAAQLPNEQFDPATLTCTLVSAVDNRFEATHRPSFPIEERTANTHLDGWLDKSNFTKWMYLQRTEKLVECRPPGYAGPFEKRLVFFKTFDHEAKEDEFRIAYVGSFTLLFPISMSVGEALFPIMHNFWITKFPDRPHPDPDGEFLIYKEYDAVRGPSLPFISGDDLIVEKIIPGDVLIFHPPHLNTKLSVPRYVYKLNHTISLSIVCASRPTKCFRYKFAKFQKAERVTDILGAVLHCDPQHIKFGQTSTAAMNDAEAPNYRDTMISELLNRNRIAMPALNVDTGLLEYPTHTIYYEILPVARSLLSTVRKLRVSLWPETQSEPFTASLFVARESKIFELFGTIAKRYVEQHQNSLRSSGTASVAATPRRFELLSLERLMNHRDSFILFEMSTAIHGPVHSVHPIASQRLITDIRSQNVTFQQLPTVAEAFVPVFYFETKTLHTVPTFSGTSFLLPILNPGTVALMLTELQEFLAEPQETFGTWKFYTHHNGKLGKLLDKDSQEQMIDVFAPQSRQRTSYSDQIFLAIERPQTQSTNAMSVSAAGVRILN